MSKSQLKKELAKLDRDQLSQLILDAYSARKEIKAFFDFFAEPDVQALYNKYSVTIHRELSRGKHRYSTARMSRIRAAIKEFSSYGVEPEIVIDLAVFAIRTALIVKKIKYTKPPFDKGIVTIANDILKLGDKEGIFSTAHNKLNQALDGSEGSRWTVNNIRQNIGFSPL